MCSTREGVSTRKGNFVHLPFIKSPSRVLRVCLTGSSVVSHGYCGYASLVLRVCLTGTANTLYRVNEAKAAALLIVYFAAALTSLSDSVSYVTFFIFRMAYGLIEPTSYSLLQRNLQLVKTKLDNKDTALCITVDLQEDF